NAESSPVATPRGSETILVVEDEAGVRAITCEFLKSGGYSVLEAGNGAEALEVISRHKGKIHLVLSDMVMPNMGGTALVERLKTVLPEVPVLLVSGYSEYSKASEEPGSKLTILQKPVSRTVLIQNVREALQRSAADRRQLVV